MNSAFSIAGPRLVIGDKGRAGVSQGLHNIHSSREAEIHALAQQVQPHALMALAGWGAARLARAVAPHAQQVWVLAGPGNNGGDGLVAALHLHRAGLQVQVWMPAAAEGAQPADARWALQQAQAAGVAITATDPLQREHATPPDLVIDALLGLGATRAPAGPLADAITRVNALGGAGAGATVLALDLPSGLHADTGALLGLQAVRATHTLSLLTVKPGLFTGQGRDHAGEVWLDDLAVQAGAPTAALVAPPARRARQHQAHKGSFGDVLVVGGAAGTTGAAWLAARASLAAGAGRVYVSLLDEAALAQAAAQAELMQRPQGWLMAPQQLAIHTVVCGCGGGDKAAGALPPLLAHAPRLVLDADGLNAIAADTALAQQLRQRQARGQCTVITPHPLEAARLLGCSTAQVQNDRLLAARELAEKWRCTVVLKGSGTVVTAPGALTLINPTGNAALASAGTGDVLAGWLAGRWSQAPAERAQQVAAWAAWEHGRAADTFAGAAGGSPLRAGQLIEALIEAA